MLFMLGSIGPKRIVPNVENALLMGLRVGEDAAIVADAKLCKEAFAKQAPDPCGRNLDHVRPRLKWVMYV